MNPFKCAGCTAKDAEIVRLIAQLGERDDRLMAMVGERFQTQFQHTTLTGYVPVSDEALEALSDSEWANQELERVAADVEKSGKLQPDFPSA